jgi:hypothetical protein
MVQTAYGTEPTAGLTELPISCKILDMRYSIGDKHKVLRGFDAPNACTLLEQCSDISLHLEYIPQLDDTLLARLANRTAEMKLTPLAFVLELNHYNTTVANKSSYLFWGCKCKNVNISSSINNEYIISADFSVKQTASVNNSLASLAAWTVPAPLTGAYLAFNVAGTIVKTGGATAYLTESINIDINHNTTDKYDHDSTIKQYCIEGAYDITGSCDISLDEGGRVYTNEILDQTEFILTVTMGAAGAPIITIPGCKWKTGGVDANISGDILADSASFTGKPSDGVLDTIVT